MGDPKLQLKRTQEEDPKLQLERTRAANMMHTKPDAYTSGGN
jgi:hypothetical protein